MKEFLIAGAGRQGAAAGAFILEQFDDTRVVFADRDAEQLQRAAGLQRERARVEVQQVDESLEDARLTTLLQRCCCVVSCVPYFLNERLMRQAVGARTHFCDLGGNKDTVTRQLAQAEQARAAGTSVIPDCGVAPGTAGVLAEYWQDNWDYESVLIRCGGLPQEPNNLLKYELTFSAWGLLNEYLDDCEVARDGHVATVPGLSDLEVLEDLPVAGRFEAFATSGGASTAPALYAAQGVDYEYRTIRYAGHRDRIVTLRDLGFFDQDTPATRADGTPLGASLREVSVGVLERQLLSDRRDLMVLRVEIVGRRGGQRRRGRLDLLDRADARFTAMERTTGFSAAIVSALQAGLYSDRIPPGGYVPFQVVPPQLLIDEHRRAGVDGFRITDTEA